MPQGMGVVANMKFFPDYLGNALQRPQFGLVSGGLRSAQ
jgi:hypothetical protein